MTIIVKETKKESEGDLSPIARKLLRTIKGADAWFKQNAASNGQVLKFRTESELLCSMLEGLQNLTNLYLPSIGVYISPRTMLNLPYRDAELLTSTSVGSNNPSLDYVLNCNRLISATQIVLSSEFLASLSIQDNPLFTIMNPEDWLSVFIFSRKQTSSKNAEPLLPEAVNFSVKNGSSATEFCRLAYFYIALSLNKNLINLSPENRIQTITDQLQNWIVLLQDQLNCPQYPPLESKDEFDAAIKDWIRQGGAIGFSDVITGAHIMAEYYSAPAHASLTDQGFLQTLLQDISQSLSHWQTADLFIAQNGRNITAVFERDDLQAEIIQNHNGALALSAFSKK